MSTVSGRGPEWISQTIIDASVYTEDGLVPVRVRIGIIQLPNGGGRRSAAQIVGEDRPLVILPPRSIARTMGALRAGLLVL